MKKKGHFENYLNFWHRTVAESVDFIFPTEAIGTLLVIKSKRYHYDKRDESRFQIRFNIFCARIFINPFRAFAPS